MKALGAFSVVVGCALLGFVRALLLAKQERCIAAVIDSLRYMISEMRMDAPPLPVLIAHLAEYSGEEVRGFYSKLCSAMELLGQESFEALWSGALMTDRELCLNAARRRILCKAGAFMGRFSAKEQCAALEGCIARLEPEHRLALEKAREGRRLYPGLGLTAGIMLAAMFL
jgi:stage III sporulation protein AB